MPDTNCTITSDTLAHIPSPSSYCALAGGVSSVPYKLVESKAQGVEPGYQAQLKDCKWEKVLKLRAKHKIQVLRQTWQFQKYPEFFWGVQAPQHCLSVGVLRLEKVGVAA